VVERTTEEKDIKKKDIVLPLGTIKRIMKEQGVYSINKTALIEVRMILQDILKDMSRNIVIFTKHRNKKISTKEDVLLSIK